MASASPGIACLYAPPLSAEEESILSHFCDAASAVIGIRWIGIFQYLAEFDGFYLRGERGLLQEAGAGLIDPVPRQSWPQAKRCMDEGRIVWVSDQPVLPASFASRGGQAVPDGGLVAAVRARKGIWGVVAAQLDLAGDCKLIEEKEPALSSLIGQMVSSLENLSSFESLTLHEGIEGQLRLLEALNAIGHAITTSLCPSDVLKAFAREYKKIIPYDRMDIVLLVGDGEHYHCLGADADYENPLGSEQFMGVIKQSTLGRTVLETGEAMLFDDYDNDPRFLRLPMDEVIRNVENIHSGLLVPLRARGRLIGSLDCGSKQIGRYNSGHLAIAQRVADQIAPYLETLDLYQKECKQAERIATLNQINKEILLGLDFHTIVVTIAHETQNILKHDQIDIVLSAEGSTGLTSSLRTLPTGARVRLSVADTGDSDSIYINSASIIRNPDSFFAARPFLSGLFRGMDLRSTVALPLQARDITLGLLLISSNTEGAFKNSDVNLAEQIADQIAVALEHERLVCRERDMAATEERNRLMLEQREREVRLSAQWLIEGAEQERGRLAMDLHDQTLGNLTLLCARAEKLLTQEFQSPESVKEEIAILAKGLKDSITDVRQVMENLHPSTLDLLGLSDSIESCLYKAAQTAIPRIAVRFNNNLVDEEPQLDDLQKISLYRIVQEAINNAFEHSQANRVEVSTSKSGLSLLIEVRDNGCGFDASGLAADSYGFRNMRYRAGLIGAELNITSNGSGTTISVALPV